MDEPRRQYQSYLLRLWRSGADETWRVMLEVVGAEERRGFADLESLFAFLREQTYRAAEEPPCVVPYHPDAEI